MTPRGAFPRYLRARLDSTHCSVRSNFLNYYRRFVCSRAQPTAPHRTASRAAAPLARSRELDPRFRVDYTGRGVADEQSITDCLIGDMRYGSRLRIDCV